MYWWPIAIVASLVVTALVNIGMVVVAVSSQTGVIEDSPYHRGERYQETIDKLSLFPRLGIAASTVVETIPSAELALVSLSLKSEELLPEVARVRLTATRPSTAELDLTADLAEVGSGRFEQALPLSRGLWLLNFEIVTAKGVGQVRERIFVE